MAATTIAYLTIFFLSLIGSVFFHPIIGLMAYLFTYHVNPLAQWWGSSLPGWTWRYALFLGVATFLGIIFQNKKLKFKSMLETQEILLIIFVGIVGLSVLLGFGREGSGSNVIKMAKILVILMMASHLITTLERYELMVFVLIFSGCYLGIQTYNASDYLFAHGRLQEGVGGSDFSDGNVLSGHFVMLLPIIGIMLIKGGWKTKLLCAVSAVFVLNGIILIKSRASFLALILSIFSALLFSKMVGRKKILPYLIIGLIGGATLMDPGYLVRMDTINTDAEEMDSSASGRIRFWKIAVAMAYDHPLGVGEGNYINFIEMYDPELKGKDTHNTYLRCLAELGFHGLLVLLLLIINAFRILSTISKGLDQLKNKQIYLWHIYALKLSLIGYLILLNFISATYVEDFYWLLMFPVFLKRSMENEDYQTV